MEDTVWRTAVKNLTQAKERTAMPPISPSPISDDILYFSMYDPEIVAAARNLDTFLASSQGRTACQLLKLSNSTIIIAEAGGFFGSETFYLLDYDGLRLSIEPTGTIAAYNPTSRSVARCIATTEVVTAYANYKQQPPDSIVSYIKNQLTKKAETINHQAHQTVTD